MQPPPITRIVAHSLWLTVAVVGNLLFYAHLDWSAIDHDPDLGRGSAAALLFVVLFFPVWAAGSIVCGAVTGLGAALAVRLTARSLTDPRLHLVAGAVGHHLNRRVGGPSVPALVACSLLAILGLGGAVVALNAQPPADAVERARALATPTPSPTPGVQPSPRPPSAKPSVPASVKASTATSTLTELASIATASRPDLLWPQKPAITKAECALESGAPGTMFFLTGRFTTRDMADVHGPDEVLEVSRANERVAQQIVTDWLDSGLVAGVDRLHGEWYLGTPAGGAVELAHVGFTDAVGDLRVGTYCTTR